MGDSFEPKERKTPGFQNTNFPYVYQFPNPIDKLRGERLSNFKAVGCSTEDQKVFERLGLESKPQPVVPLHHAGS